MRWQDGVYLLGKNKEGSDCCQQAGREAAADQASESDGYAYQDPQSGLHAATGVHQQGDGAGIKEHHQKTLVLW